MKAVSARAASPIRCETSPERDRTSVLPRFDIRLPAKARYPGPASPDHMKHSARAGLQVPPEKQLPPCRHRCGEGLRRPSRAFVAPGGFSDSRCPGSRSSDNLSSENPRFARRPLSRSQGHSAQNRCGMYVMPLHSICDETFPPKGRKTSPPRHRGRAPIRHSHSRLRQRSVRRSDSGSPERTLRR